MNKAKIIFGFLPLLVAGFLLQDNSIIDGISSPSRYDGPYVLYKNDKVYVNYIFDDKGVKTVQTDSVPVSEKII